MVEKTDPIALKLSACKHAGIVCVVVLLMVDLKL